MGVILVRSVATASSTTVKRIRDMSMMRLKVVMVLALVTMAAARGMHSGNVFPRRNAAKSRRAAEVTVYSILQLERHELQHHGAAVRVP